jgi:hypothetical protein
MRPTHAFPLRPLLVLAVLTLALPPARADDSVPPGGFPPPGGAPSTGNLPPPTSRRIRGTPPTGAVALPAGTAAPAAPGSTGTAPVRREVSGTGIVETRVSEDVALTGGGTAVQLVVRFRVLRDDGRHFYVNALFFDRGTGQAVTSRRDAFADVGTGALYVISQPAVHAGGDREYEVTLQVPYDAFPTPPAGSSAGVDARVSLFRRSLAGGMDESMDWTTAAFIVRAAAAAPAPITSPVTPTPAFPTPSNQPPPTVVPAVEPPIPASPPLVTMPSDSAAATRIVSITKKHNQQVSDGRLELWIPVRYRVVGEAGRSFYAQCIFFDRASGQPIASLRSAFADRTTGVLYVLTQPVSHPGGSTEYEATLRVPYDAFPRPAAGATTSIEARVTLFRRDLAAGMDASMDVSSVTFNIHGS